MYPTKLQFRASSFVYIVPNTYTFYYFTSQKNIKTKSYKNISYFLLYIDIPISICYVTTSINDPLPKLTQM